MTKLLWMALPAALTASPAMSATYHVQGYANGLPGDVRTADTPLSISGGGNSSGYGASFNVSATNVNGGSVSLSGSEAISSIEAYNNSGAREVGSALLATVMYNVEIVGPATNTLIPVDVTMFAHAGALAISTGGDDQAPVSAYTDAAVLLGYSDGLSSVPALPTVYASSYYNYKYYTGQTSIPPSVESQDSSFNGVALIAANQDFYVDVYAQAGFQFGPGGGASAPEYASGSAEADPTFAITDPAFADYKIVGVPEGTVSPVPLPASAPMFGAALIGLAGLGYAAKRKKAASV